MTTSRERDEEIVQGVRAGDRAAFERLFRTYYPGMLRFARSQLGETAEAEDAVHDVFLRVWRDREGWAVERSLPAYLLGAVRNRVLDVQRRRGFERRWFQPLEGRAASSGGDAPPSTPDPASLADPGAVAELEAALRRAVDGLPERCRAAFLLCRTEGLSYAEAAEVLGVSPATVKTQMARALAALRVAAGPFLALLMISFR